MASRKPEDLTDRLLEKYNKWKDKCNQAGVNTLLTCTARSIQEQTALFAQGRQELEETNRLRRACGLPEISHIENKRKVTWTLASKHIINLYDDIKNNDKAYAFDFVIVGKDNKPSWDIKANINGNEIADYQEAGQIGESVGLEWGGRWGNPDYPHLQLSKKDTI